MSQDITETRICVQKMLPHHQMQMHSLQQSGHSTEHVQRLAAAFWTKKIWPKGSEITIGFLDNGEKIPKTSIEKLKVAGRGKLDPLQNQVSRLTSVPEMVRMVVTERIVPLVNLKIKFIDDASAAIVRISFDPNGGAWSLVGTDHLAEKKKPTMNLGWFDVPTTIHEFGHMLGMIHEHQNPRGNQIKWNKSKLLAWAKDTQGWSDSMTEKNIIDKYNKSMINGSDFDPLSIMLYFFPPKLTTNNVGTQQNLRLSGIDVQWIHDTYPNSNGESPSEFYQEAYNDSIKASIAESKRLAEKFAKAGDWSMVGSISNRVEWKKLGITLFILFVMILLGIGIWKFILKRKRYGRSYRYK